MSFQTIKNFGSKTLELINSAYFNYPSTLYDKIPYVSIILFIIATVLKIIQKTRDDSKYLQSTIYNKDDKQMNPITALFMNYLELMGLNSFFDINGNNIIYGIFLLIITYLLLSIIELNVGHAMIIFFVIILILYQYYAYGYQKLVCENDTNTENEMNGSMCCGSFLMWATVGCFIGILFKHSNKYITKAIIGIIGLILWGILVIIDYFTIYSNKNDSRLCYSFTWHANNFLFGIITGIVIGNKTIPCIQVLHTITNNSI